MGLVLHRLPLALRPLDQDLQASRSLHFLAETAIKITEVILPLHLPSCPLDPDPRVSTSPQFSAETVMVNLLLHLLPSCPLDLDPRVSRSPQFLAETARNTTEEIILLVYLPPLYLDSLRSISPQSSVEMAMEEIRPLHLPSCPLDPLPSRSQVSVEMVIKTTEENILLVHLPPLYLDSLPSIPPQLSVEMAMEEIRPLHLFPSCPLEHLPSRSQVTVEMVIKATEENILPVHLPPLYLDSLPPQLSVEMAMEEIRPLHLFPSCPLEHLPSRSQVTVEMVIKAMEMAIKAMEMEMEETIRPLHLLKPPSCLPIPHPQNYPKANPLRRNLPRL
jgi:hypothetical protein